MSELVHILLVDDDEDDVFFATRALKEAGLHSIVESVSNGEELLDYLYRRGEYDDRTSPDPDLILLDLNMPRMNGKEALQAIRSSNRWAHVPIVIFTTSQAEQDVLTSYRMGANSYIKKPVDFDGLVSVMRGVKSFWEDTVILPPHLS